MGEVVDELQGILDELADQEPMRPIVPVSESVQLNIEPAPIGPVVEPQLSNPVPVVVEEPPDLVFNDSQDSEDTFKVQEFLTTHERDYEETKRNIRNDRAKVDTVLQLLLQKVQAGGATAAETESLVAAAKALVDSNGHMVRLLDSKSKLLTSIKGNVTINNNNTAVANSGELVDLLSQDPNDDQV